MQLLNKDKAKNGIINYVCKHDNNLTVGARLWEFLASQHIYILCLCFCVGECVCVYDKDREILYIWRLLQSSTTVGGCALAPARLSVASSIDYIY